jgi:hypothetical protein
MNIAPAAGSNNATRRRGDWQVEIGTRKEEEGERRKEEQRKRKKN